RTQTTQLCLTQAFHDLCLCWGNMPLISGEGSFMSRSVTIQEPAFRATLLRVPERPTYDQLTAGLERCAFLLKRISEGDCDFDEAASVGAESLKLVIEARA